ncbi:MAG: tRNA epoxyqueuosine(34) reductase QueG [Zetaproteobacteria bacterium CG1_02_53_45]|nr:MAG: tRNA epoxyqueuosine(34) reductase QueG [Zetaproteobacteria bacterium CG1_02_53_45]
MHADEIKSTIRKKASQHGFELCYVTRPAIDSKHALALQKWVEADMQGDMAWMAEASRLQRRKEPQSMLDDVNAVITVAMRYAPPEYALAQACAATDHGVITAYAHGDDYHDVMKKRLKMLAHDLDEELGKHDQRVFVDTAPVLEHALAESAGLGWQGKHTLTIHRELGSWLLLGEIFTTADIAPDEPAINHCGSCSACIDVCPTGAIVAPYVVDARLCISYLTIEYDGFIPRELRPKMGNRIYGCDDCQQICPWNGHARKAVRLDEESQLKRADLLNPRGENVLPDLARLLQLDAESFREAYRKSPIKRTKRAGLLRNVCVAMGNSANRGFIPVLLAVLDDDEALIRGHAVWALAKLAGAQERDSLLKAMLDMQASEQDDRVQDELTASINDLRMV